MPLSGGEPFGSVLAGGGAGAARLGDEGEAGEELNRGTSKYSACGRSREDFSSDKTKFRTRSCPYAKGFCEI